MGDEEELGPAPSESAKTSARGRLLDLAEDGGMLDTLLRTFYSRARCAGWARLVGRSVLGAAAAEVAKNLSPEQPLDPLLDPLTPHRRPSRSADDSVCVS